MLRWIIRDGERVLQEQSVEPWEAYKDESGASVYGSKFVWNDVPTEEEE